MGLLFGNNSSPKRDENPIDKPRGEGPVPFSERKFDPKTPQSSSSGGFLDTLLSKSNPVKPVTKESITGSLHKTKSKVEIEGIDVDKFSKVLEKIENNMNIKMERSQRGKVAYGIKRNGSSRKIRMEDFNKHIKLLGTKQSMEKTNQKRLDAGHEEYLIKEGLERLKEQK